MNKDAILVKVKEYRIRNRKVISAKARVYSKANRKTLVRQQMAYKKRRRANDPAFNLIVLCRYRVGSALRAARAGKQWSTMELIGCTPMQLMEHIQKQFKPGMAWNNRYLWHIDHIRPCASFDLTDPEQQRRCFHFTNLQPLWAKENLSKGSRLESALPGCVVTPQATNPDGEKR